MASTVLEVGLREGLKALFDPSDIDILVGLWQTSCQLDVATRLQLTQGRVRHRFFTAVKTLESAAERDDRFTPYHRIFSFVSSHPLCQHCTGHK